MVHISLLSLVSICAWSFPVQAQVVVTPTQILSFGTIAIQNLTDNVNVRIRNNGTFTTNANTYIISDPQRGEYLLTGGPASSTYTVTTPATVTLTGPGGIFTVDNFRVRPNTLVTNGAGEDNFRIAGRLRSVSGTVFGDGLYNDTFNITINF